MLLSAHSKPKTIQETFAFACDLHQKGHLHEALDIYIELLDHIDDPLLFYNLGLVQHSLGNVEIALRCFESAVEAAPEDLDSIFNLAICQKECGMIDEACESYQQVLTHQPDHIDALYNLGGCHRVAGKYNLAITEYSRVLELQPDHFSARNNLAYVYHLAGKEQQAADHYREVLRLDPENPSADYMLAAIEGADISRPPEQYVRDVFDNYSSYYENNLIYDLKYNVPADLRQLLDEVTGEYGKFKHVLDLGCGTGLSGEAFVDIAERLDGVDLSGKMLEQAAAKDIYTTLTEATLENAVYSTEQKYDLIIASDVFIYIGDLVPVFTSIESAAEVDAVMCFSTETCGGQSYSVQATGRFSHSPEYIFGMAQTFGWEVVSHRETHLRKEREEWLAGRLWILSKSRGNRTLTQRSGQK